MSKEFRLSAARSLGSATAEKRFGNAQTKAGIAHFIGDQHLVHGRIDVASFGKRVAPEGTYSLRFLTPEMSRDEARPLVTKARRLVVSCMDERVIRTYIDKTIADSQNSPRPLQEDEIAVLAIAGGPIQPGKKEKPLYTHMDFTDLGGHNANTVTARKAALTSFVTWFLTEKAHGQEQGVAVHPEGIDLVAHTSGLTGEAGDNYCGGVKLFSGNRPIGDAVADDYQQALLQSLHGPVDMELAATMEALVHSGAHLIRRVYAKTGELYLIRDLIKSINLTVVSPDPHQRGPQRLQMTEVPHDLGYNRLVTLLSRP